MKHGFLIGLAAVVQLPSLLSAQSALREGAGRQTVERMCMACHSLDVVMAPPQTRERWRDIVQDMVARGARGNSGDIETVVRYLAAHYGIAGTDNPEPVASRNETAPAAAKNFDHEVTVARDQEWPARWCRWMRAAGGPPRISETTAWLT